MKQILFILFIIFVCIVAKASTMEKPMTYHVIPQQELHALLPLIQKLRVENYVHFPYLYISEGAAGEDVSYYEHSPKALAVVAKQGDNIEALAVGIPFVEFQSSNLDFSAKRQFEATLGKNIEHYFYVSELLFCHSTQAHQQNEEIGINLLKRMEKELHGDKNFSHIAMLIVKRPPDHPLRNEWFIDESKLLNSLGYTKTHYAISIAWKTRLDKYKTERQDNILSLWSKNIN